MTIKDTVPSARRSGVLLPLRSYQRSYPAGSFAGQECDARLSARGSCPHGKLVIGRPKLPLVDGTSWVKRTSWSASLRLAVDGDEVVARAGSNASQAPGGPVPVTALITALRYLAFVPEGRVIGVARRR
jgi:hypothetical protein